MDLSRFDTTQIPGGSVALRDEILSSTIVKDGVVFIDSTLIDGLLKEQALATLGTGNLDGALGLANVAQALIDIKDARLTED